MRSFRWDTASKAWWLPASESGRPSAWKSTSSRASSWTMSGWRTRPWQVHPYLTISMKCWRVSEIFAPANGGCTCGLRKSSLWREITIRHGVKLQSFSASSRTNFILRLPAWRRLSWFSPAPTTCSPIWDWPVGRAARFAKPMSLRPRIICEKRKLMN